MQENEELFYENKRMLMEQMEVLSEEKRRKNNKLQNEIYIQTAIINMFDRIIEREPEIEKNDKFVEAYHTVKESSNRIIEGREEQYYQACRSYMQAETEVEELVRKYYTSVAEAECGENSVCQS